MICYDHKLSQIELVIYINCQNIICYTHLYYKERKQFNTFLTHIGPVVPHKLDPPVRVRPTCQSRGSEGMHTHRNHILGDDSAEKAFFFSPDAVIPTRPLFARMTPTLLGLSRLHERAA